MELLSSSPLLAALFASYANRAAALEASTPSTKSESTKSEKLEDKNLQAAEKDR